mgnify:CR=1 FL=1
MDNLEYLKEVEKSIQKKYKKIKDDLKKKIKNKTITVEEKLELEEASRHYYVLKKFNWLLFSNNNKIFDENNEKKFHIGVSFLFEMCLKYL